MKKALFKYSLQSLLSVLLLVLFVNCAGKPEDTLERIANETNSVVPQIIDEYTTMTGCEVLANRTLKFTYAVKGNFSEIQKEEMSVAMKSILIERLKERKEIEFYLVNNVRFEHLFLDGGNKVVMDVKIEALDYK